RVLREGPAQAVLADEVGQELDVLLREGAQGRELALAQAGVAVQLERLADEHEGHDAVEREGAADALVGHVVEEARRAGLLDALEEALDQAAGLVLLR